MPTWPVFGGAIAPLARRAGAYLDKKAIQLSILAFHRLIRLGDDQVKKEKKGKKERKR